MESDYLAMWLADHWGSGITSRSTLPRGFLPDESQILATIDCGLLSTPYVEVYRDNAMLPQDAVFTARTVQNHSVPGFLHFQRVMNEFRLGATLRFPAIDDWLPDVRRLTRSVCSVLNSGVEATAYLAAAGALVTVPDRQRDLTLIMCSGTVGLRIADEGAAGSDGGPPTEVRTAPGDVLYLPASTIHEAAAGTDGCLFLTLSNRELTNRELIRSLQEMASAHLSKRPENERHHLMMVEERAGWVRSELTRYFSSLEPRDFARLLVESG
jgi:hypothetical protein